MSLWSIVLFFLALLAMLLIYYLGDPKRPVSVYRGIGL